MLRCLCKEPRALAGSAALPLLPHALPTHCTHASQAGSAALPMLPPAPPRPQPHPPTPPAAGH